jgi:hypothetical protein
LLAVAVGRARRLGRGGDITRYQNPGASEIRDQPATIVFNRFHRIDGVRIYEHVRMPILNPRLTDVSRILDVLGKLESGLSKVLKVKDRDYVVNAGLLPLELQVTLKEIVDATITAALNAKLEETKEDIGSLLVTCDPRAVRVEVGVEVESRRAIHIFYSCKSHADSERELWIWLQRDKDELGKPVWYAISSILSVY